MVLLGYERGRSIRGAPFGKCVLDNKLDSQYAFILLSQWELLTVDFRLAPNEQDEYFKKLIQLIESTYLMNDKKKVILICHSMGCLYSMNLLNLKVNAEWKNRYISTLFAFSSPWTGSIRAVKTMVTGDNMGIFLFNDKRFKGKCWIDLICQN